MSAQLECNVRSGYGTAYLHTQPRWAVRTLQTHAIMRRDENLLTFDAVLTHYARKATVRSVYYTLPRRLLVRTIAKR